MGNELNSERSENLTENHYRLDRIKKKKAKYNVIFGQRSNGKTYSVLEEILINYCKYHQSGAYIRRWSEDFKRQRANNLWNGIRRDELVSKYSNGEWDDIYYVGYKAYLCRFDDKNNRILDDVPFCYYFSITEMEHDKSADYNMITTVCFDECICKAGYLPDEFVLFMNVLSTIIRDRDNVIIYMLGNTVNKYCIYFKEMGLTNILKMKRGDIEVYQYGNSDLTVAVEYAENFDGNSKSAVYFAFDNPKLQMITGGEWELDFYPHLTIKYLPKDIIFTYFIIFNETTLQCEIIDKNDNVFTFIHLKTTPIKDEDEDLIFQAQHDYRRNYKRNILKPDNDLTKFIRDLYLKEKIFYQNNDIGNLVDNYLRWCRTTVK